jgi:hypothetical protein
MRAERWVGLIPEGSGRTPARRELLNCLKWLPWPLGST